MRRLPAGHTASCTSWKATCRMRATGTAGRNAHSRRSRLRRRKSRRSPRRSPAKNNYDPGPELGFGDLAAAAQAGDAAQAREHQSAELLGRHGPREEKALRLLAAERAQEGGLRVALDALGDDGEAKRVRHLDDGAHDGGIRLVVEHIGDERAIDFERGERKAREIGEARVAGAEVVDRDSHAGLAEPAQYADGVIRIVHQLAFGDFELDQRRRDAGASDDGADPLLEVMLAE